MNSAEKNEHELFERIFQQEIYPKLFNDLRKPSNSKPCVVFMGGQPGSGKSVRERFITMALNEREPNTTIEINGDDFRAFHPNYFNLLVEDDSSAATKIDRDNKFFIENSINAAMNIGANVVLEGTFRQANVVQSTAENFAEKGYASEAALLVVHPVLSRVGIMRRYFEQKAILSFARYTELSAHDAALEGISRTTQTIIENASVERMHLVTRDGSVLLNEWLCDKSQNNLEAIAETAKNILNEHWSDLSEQDINFAKRELGIMRVAANKLSIPRQILSDLDDLEAIVDAF